MARTGYQGLPLTFEVTREALRHVAQVVNNILSGKQNNVTDLTLTANAATTTITDNRIGYYSHLSFTPTTKNAAMEIGQGTLYVSSRTTGSAVVTHANNAQTDRTFTVEITG